MSECYVVSLKHTKRRDPYITVWRPNDLGYAYPLSWAGRYPAERIREGLGYYNSGCAAVAVPCEVLDAIAVAPKPRTIDNDAGPVVLNTAASWRKILAAVIEKPHHEPQPEYRGRRKAQQAQGGEG